MQRSVKIANGILMVVFFLALVVNGLKHQVTLSSALGFAIWIVMAYVTMKAADEPETSLYPWALGLNWFCIVCLGYAIVMRLTKAAANPGALIGLIVVGGPCVWNVYALPVLKRTVQRVVERKSPVIGDDVPLGGYEPSASIGVLNDAPIKALAVSDADAPTSAELDRSNYFMRHWRGDLPLPISYWVNGPLLGGAMFVFTDALRHFDDMDLRLMSMMWLAVLALIVVLTIWSFVGIMRSASKHSRRGGSSGWAMAAQVMTVLGGLSFAVKFATLIAPQMKEFALMSANADPIARVHATVTQDGRGLALQGEFGLGSFDLVKQILSASPGVRTVVLDSNGGRLLEAKHIAQLVRERKLNTYVEGQCLSACTYIFIAGQDRAATPNAKIGFHHPSFAGLSDDRVDVQDMLSVYRGAGVSEEFLDKVRGTPAKEMWYPTREELIQNHVINRISLGGESSIRFSQMHSRAELALAYQAEPFMLALGKRYPQVMERAIDAAWKQVQDGGTDGQITAASREVVGSIYPDLLRTSDDQHLQAFLDVIVGQLGVIKDLEPRACALFLKSQLDVTHVFPPSLVQQELDWGRSALSLGPVERPRVEPAELKQALVVAMKTMPATYLDYVGSPEKHADEPEMLCKAQYAFYRAIAELPNETRTIALRGLFQGQ